MTAHNEMDFNSDGVEEVKNGDNSDTCEMKFPKRGLLSKKRKTEYVKSFTGRPVVSDLGFSRDDEIMLGIINNVDVSVYAKPEYSIAQMRHLRLGLEAGLDVSVYANPEYAWEQMREIRLGLEKGLDVSVYAKPEYNGYQMYEIRIGLEAGLDVSVYTNPEYNWEKMEEIRQNLLKQREDDSVKENSLNKVNKMNLF